MAPEKTQYVVVPASGLQVAENNPQQGHLFQSLFQTFHSESQVHSLATHSGMLSVRVLDSIGETKAKLIECLPDDLPALRASNPSIRVLPVVYYEPAVVRYRVAVAAVPAQPGSETTGVATPGKGVRGGTTSKPAAPAAATAITITIVSAGDGTPVAKADVAAFTDFEGRKGAGGTTNAKGEVILTLGAASVVIERLYVYPMSGSWPMLFQNVTLKTGMKFEAAALDLAAVDCVRFFYGGDDPNFGTGVTVGIIDSGVALDHPGLVVQGGLNTVTGEQPTDFGDNGGEGHGTHVAGIVASRGTAPTGIRGVAPGVALRSYRVFGKGAQGASNFAIAKAIDAAVADGCDFINMSLGGGPSDPLTADAIAAAHNAGTVVFAANGNDERQPVSFPAANSLCQAVSAMGRVGTFPKDTEPSGSVAAPYGTDKNNFIADFSNIGPETDLTGPGVGVISTVPGGFAVMSGTSMATPAETGAAARLLATKPSILSMPRDQNRSDAILAALAAASQSLGFEPTFEGKGLIAVP